MEMNAQDFKELMCNSQCICVFRAVTHPSCVCWAGPAENIFLRQCRHRYFIYDSGGGTVADPGGGGGGVASPPFKRAMNN